MDGPLFRTLDQGGFRFGSSVVFPPTSILDPNWGADLYPPYLATLATLTKCHGKVTLNPEPETLPRSALRALGFEGS